MGALQPKELAKFTGILEVRPAGTSGAFSRLASVRGLVANLDNSNVVEVKADDTGTVFKATNQITTVETELLEVFGRDTLALLFNGTSTDVAGVLVSGATQVVPAGVYAFQEFIEIEHQNGNGSPITINSVTGGVDGALVNGTDYFIVKNDDGKYGITIIDSTTVTTMNQTFTINYNYTPNASENFVTNNDTQELKNFEIKITATDNGKDRIINISSATLSSTYGLSFNDIVESGNITGAKLTFTSNKGSTTTYINEIL